MKRLLLSIITLCCIILNSYAGIIKGKVTDRKTGEPLTGATILVGSTGNGAVADIDGNYSLKIKNGTYDITVKYIGYVSQTVHNFKVGGTAELNIQLNDDSQKLSTVMVVGEAKKNTEAAQLSLQKNSLVVQSGVSSQTITRTQDKDASEVIRRIPGVSIINGKFVMVRGLSQRYNNVWINGGAVPSSEPDTRSFSFDIIPSSQIDNMTVIKSPSPEYPADFTGGFILIETKEIPSANHLTIGLGTGVNDRTQFHNFYYSKGSSTDFLGFDSGLRNMKNGISTLLPGITSKPDSPDQKNIDLLESGLNNDWKVKHHHPLPNGSLSLNFSKRFSLANNQRMGIAGAMNYSNGYTSHTDMDNNFFGAYNAERQQSIYLRKAKDDQYSHDIRIGALLNLLYSPSANSKYELKNIFNQLGKDRYTYRKGIDEQDNQMESAEYYYSSRTTYNGQLTGKYDFEKSHFDWNAGYAYSGKNMPDRRRYLIDDQLEPGKIGIYNASDISREYTSLKENIFSGSLNYHYRFRMNNDRTALLKGGFYGEYRNRDYLTRNFYYNWEGVNGLPEGFRYFNIPNQLMNPDNYGENKIYLIEKPKWTNNYSANNTIMAGYLSGSLPLGKLTIYAGVRFEHNHMELIRNLRDEEKSPYSINYRYNDFFPSVNTTYKFRENSLIRLSYGRTVNRAEFREISPSVFYDFELGSDVIGNTELKPAYNNNIDLRYEFYPSHGEMASIALFYKNFDNPIEWTYTMSGGTNAIYSFMNAKSAYSLGVEVDLKKDLAFIGMRNFSLSLNASFIKSHVNFEKNSKEHNRPMQGQSPYLINCGLFYQHPTNGWSANLLYNRIGKRIIGVGRTVGTSGDVTVNIPDSYEMPRNLIDLNVSKVFFKRLTVKAGIRDLLGEKVYYKQFNDVTFPDGKKKEIVEVTKSFYPGRNFNLSISYNF